MRAAFVLPFLALIACAEDPKPETVKLGWDLPPGRRLAAVWKYSSSSEEAGAKDKSSTIETRVIEFELVADKGQFAQGAIPVTIKKATISHKTDQFEVTVTLEEGKPPTDSWKPRKPADKERVAREAQELADWHKKNLGNKYAFQFTPESVSVAVWIESMDVSDPLFGTVKKIEKAWFQGTGAPSVLNPCVFFLSLPSEEVRSGQSWPVPSWSLPGDKKVQMKVASLTKDAASLTADGSGTETKDLFGDGKAKETTSEKVTFRASFRMDGYPASISETREWSARCDSADPMWKRAKKRKTTSELTLKRLDK